MKGNGGQKLTQNDNRVIVENNKDKAVLTLISTTGLETLSYINWKQLPILIILFSVA